MQDEESGELTSPVTSRRRKRKDWTMEEKLAFWRLKKEARRKREKETSTKRREAQQREWETLNEEERERRRNEAIVVHELRRAAENNRHALCMERLTDASLPVLVFDLSFAWCMSTADCRSTVSQVKFGYSALRRHAFPMRPVITSIGGQEEAGPSAHGELLRCLCDFEGFRRYVPPVHEEHWSALYTKERVVFLTADTDSVLERLEPENVYVVGAFVDHNARKFLSRDAAVRHGVRTARLPLEEYIEVGNRCKVLTVNHVVEVLCRYADSGDWHTAFDALPTRRANEKREKRSRVSVASTRASLDSPQKEVETGDIGVGGGGDDDGDDGGKTATF